jgi:hypothetical protein
VWMTSETHQVPRRARFAVPDGRPHRHLSGGVTVGADTCEMCLAGNRGSKRTVLNCCGIPDMVKGRSQSLMLVSSVESGVHSGKRTISPRDRDHGNGT